MSIEHCRECGKLMHTPRKRGTWMTEVMCKGCFVKLFMKNVKSKAIIVKNINYIGIRGKRG